MATRTVISRTRRPDQGESAQAFAFTRDQIPALQAGWTGLDFVKQYRQRAWESFVRLPLPTTTEDAWRRTDLKSLRPGDFHLTQSDHGTTAPEAILKPLVGELHGGQIIFQPGGVQVELSAELAKQGVVFCDLATAELQHPDILKRILGQVVRPDEGKFAALAGALAQQGVLVYVPPGVTVETPLHSVLWGPGVRQAYFSHLLVYVDDGAALTYVHEAASPNEKDGQTLHAGIVEIHVGQDASLRFVELQSWGEHVYNFSHERAVVERNGNLDWIFGAIGSHLTKNFSDLDLKGEGSVGRMSGFYFTDGEQHLDHDTQQNHLAPHTSSDLLFKGALKDHSRSVWQGMIYVAPGAQKTDGYQANRNLVLSPHARADSIPGLEILADDVRCTHGATVGKIDQDQVFYLRSRGMPYEDAEHLIVEGFFDPIMQRIPFEGVRTRFQNAIQDKLA